MEKKEVLFTVSEVETLQTFTAGLRAAADTIEAMTPAEKKELAEMLKASPEIKDFMAKYKKESATETAAERKRNDISGITVTLGCEK